MKKIGLLIMYATFAFLLVGCSKTIIPEEKQTTTETMDLNVTIEREPDSAIQSQITEAETDSIRFLEITYESDAISKNLIGDSSKRYINVYLPPDYFDSDDQLYPVVYYLDGYECSARSFLYGKVSYLDEAFAKNNSFIMVSVDGNNISGGSFYVNSEVSGNWEDYIAEELVSVIDNNFRTKAASRYRGISGYSMGGFGALNIAFKHPDIFGSVLAFAPGIYAEEDISMVMNTWNGETGLLRSYAQAFSPDKDIDIVMGHIPDFSGTEEDNAIVEDWINGFSGWGKKLDEYLERDHSLLGIKIAYSENDYYGWIPRGCAYLSKLMTDKEIVHKDEIFAGGHIVPSDAIETYYTTFFNPIFSE